MVMWLINLFNIILQESIAKQINENPGAGWEAAINPRFSNYTVRLQLSLYSSILLDSTFHLSVYKCFTQKNK